MMIKQETFVCVKFGNIYIFYVFERNLLCSSSLHLFYKLQKKTVILSNIITI